MQILGFPTLVEAIKLHPRHAIDIEAFYKFISQLDIIDTLTLQRYFPGAVCTSDTSNWSLPLAKGKLFIRCSFRFSHGLVFLHSITNGDLFQSDPNNE
ncbi:hypothetical protein [Cronobacter sakazakii]|uniref:hypothetical protein n=1 Tax=Cronobacter sakazakii TaxID=28141 RepID=UPI000F5CA55F|nr:hypothetical protein [Cronobacter sakazakii]MDK1224528.1 hypothetical protein [Cronobacter turicensis]EJJ0671689.1 hypothetical protein [Cronobacter sakazakii]EMC4401976.1 hypothetical protein [Cronobacter sakazakii]KAB0805790.1 hypothetical protein FZI15_22325 [Cronobacter sakazakii]KAB0887858.1 hypothetical protein FZI07_20995 [Cronobacter sakazakii]